MNRDAMNRDYADVAFTQREWYPDAYLDPPDRGWDPVPDRGWDPVEELAHLLQEAVPTERTTAVPPPRSEPSPGVDFTVPLENLEHLEQLEHLEHLEHLDRIDQLEQIAAQLPPIQRSIRRSSAAHRKNRVRGPRITWLRTGSFMIAALVAVIVAMVSVFSGIAAYEPLQHVPAGAQGGQIFWWPFLVYGPWIVASLSILRTALHRRRALHSWIVVLAFSSVAILLCVTQAEKTFTGIAAAALPAAASLACFQQLVRQITLTLPPRQSVSRHRQ